MKKRINLTIDAETLAKLDEMAREEKRSRSNMIEVLIAKSHTTR